MEHNSARRQDTDRYQARRAPQYNGQLTNELPTARLWHQMSEVPWQLFQLSRLAHRILVYTPSALLSLGILLTQAHVSIGPPKHVKSSAET